MPDRRKTGVNHVLLTDNGTGENMRLVTATAKTGQLLIGVILSILTLGGVILGAVKWGVSTQAREVIEEECEQDGMIYEEIQDTAREFIEEVQVVIQDDLDVFDGRMMEQHDLGIRLEERQIAIEKKVDDHQQELIREIRRAGGG